VKDGVPRLRMFAGPNGSGKTTVKNSFERPPSWYGMYINPDELEKSIRETGRLELSPFGLEATTEEVREFFLASPLLRERRLTAAVDAIECSEGIVSFGALEMNSYFASVLADFLRRKAIEALKSFTFETVMSSPDKVALLRQAQESGYRTYLYFIATEDPSINIQRVKQRVSEGGHDVPEDKIVSRYHRSLALLREAIRYSNRAYLFDTSDDLPRCFAETTDGTLVKLTSVPIPNWFQPIWSRF